MKESGQNRDETRTDNFDETECGNCDGGLGCKGLHPKLKTCRTCLCFVCVRAKCQEESHAS